MQKISPPLRLGLTIWSHNSWLTRFYGVETSTAQRLEKYAQVFHTVEGNSTFYASPSVRTVANWNSATPDDFRFTFKLPKLITHERRLKNCKEELNQFITLLEPLHEKIGMWTIQLPAVFSPMELAALTSFTRLFPKSAPLGVEVRHPEFFSKGDSEKRLNQYLIEQNIDRIIMDSRPIFSPDNSHLTQRYTTVQRIKLEDAQRKKPRVPVHAIATSNRPLIRFIGLPNPEENIDFIAPWKSKLNDWITQGKQPYLMIHTTDNDYAPELAAHFYQSLCDVLSLPKLRPFPADSDPQQISIF
jgi:uncharacterized protein YecE (DUF72 family)